MFSSAGTVDADVRREAEVNVCIWESSLISLFRVIKSGEGICPSRTEGYKQHGFVFARLGFLCSHLLVVH